MALDISYDSTIQIPNLAPKLAGSFTTINSSYIVYVVNWYVSGTLTTGVNKGWEVPILIDVARPPTLVSAMARVKTAPTSLPLIVDINKNGTTIYTNQANRPTILATAFASAETGVDVTALANLDVLTIDIDQVGSAVAGADLSVVLKVKQTVVFP